MLLRLFRHVVRVVALWKVLEFRQLFMSISFLNFKGLLSCAKLRFEAVKEVASFETLPKSFASMMYVLMFSNWPMFMDAATVMGNPFVAKVFFYSFKIFGFYFIMPASSKSKLLMCCYFHFFQLFGLYLITPSRKNMLLPLLFFVYAIVVVVAAAAPMVATIFFYSLKRYFIMTASSEIILLILMSIFLLVQTTRFALDHAEFQEHAAAVRRRSTR